MKRTYRHVISVLVAGLFAAVAFAQISLTPAQLDQLVGRVALYPDPLLAQLLTASTYSDQIRDAANWADQHKQFSGPELASAIQRDNLPWDPSVIALLPFPSALDMMADNIFWTRQLGDAVLGQRAEVMDAVQRMRQTASRFGYLQDVPQYRVVRPNAGVIEILPADPAFYYLPVYDPLVVFGRPRVGVSLGISFGPRITIGTAFAPWGWGRSGFGWPARQILLDGHAWARTRENHATYFHPYIAPEVSRRLGPRLERHEVRPTREWRNERRTEGK